MATEKPFCMFHYDVLQWLKCARSETEKAYYLDLFAHYAEMTRPGNTEPAEEPAKPENLTGDNITEMVRKAIKKSIEDGKEFYTRETFKKNERNSIGGLKTKIKNKYSADDPQAAKVLYELDERKNDLNNSRLSNDEYLQKWEVSAKEAVQNWEESRADSLPVMPDSTNTFETLPKWFETFWGEYLKKTGRDEAEKEFKKVCTSESNFDEIMAGLRRLNDQDYRYKDVQFLPNPAAWLKGRRWNDAAIPPIKAAHVPDFIRKQECGEYDNEETAAPQDIEKFREHVKE